MVAKKINLTTEDNVPAGTEVKRKKYGKNKFFF
jgi:hypothetical protein